MLRGARSARATFISGQFFAQRLRHVIAPHAARRAHGLPDSDDLLPSIEDVVDMMLMPGALQPSSGAMSVA